MRKGFAFSKKLMFCFVVLSLLLCGCGQGKQQPSPQMQSAQTEQKSDKIPDQLKEIENSVEKVIKTLNGPAVQVKEEQGGGSQSSSGNKEQSDKQPDKENKSSQDQGSGQGKDSSQKKSGSQDGQNQKSQSGQDQKGQSDQGNQTQSTQQPQQKDPWTEISSTVNELHYKWNQYTPMAAKSGAGKDLLDGFGNALNNLTDTIKGKSDTNTLLASNSLYSYVADLFSLYKTENSPEIKRIRYYIRNVILNSKAGDWTKADSDFNNLKTSWDIYKNTLSKDQQDISNRLYYSIYELGKVLKEKNPALVDVKGRVSLSNVEAIEKENEKGSQGGSQGK